MRRFFGINRIDLIFIGLVTYFTLVAASIYYFKVWQDDEDTKTEHLRILALNARAFEEENYRTQLLLWNYIYEGTPFQITEFNELLTRFNKKFDDFKKSFKALEHYFDEEIIRQVALLEEDFLERKSYWLTAVTALKKRNTSDEIKKWIEKAESKFKRAQFEQKINFLMNKTDSVHVQIVNKRHRVGWVIAYIQVFETILGILVAVIALFYIHKLERRNVDQREKMVISSRLSALGEMAGGIAHEINTPLAAMILKSEQVLDFLQSEKNPNPEALRLTEGVLTTAEKIARIVAGLRAVSRDGSQDPVGKFGIGKIFDDVFDLCYERLKSRSVDLKKELIFNGFVECRSTEISQVLVNLINNSSDAIEMIEEKWIHLQAQDRGTWVEICVTDSGRGIPAQIQEKIFQPFFTTKEVGKGTGLGLSLSRKIIEDHRGKLYIDTQCPNSRFVIRLPKTQPPNQTKTA